jgi:riboflavin synthase alpha subunit
VALGESIAVSGVCLTAVAHRDLGGGAEVVFEAVPETLSKTTLGRLRAGDAVNLERSLAVGDRLGGHYVTGHVDGTGTIRARRREGDQVLFEVAAPAELLRQVIPKGSVAIDGISLTVIDVNRHAGYFSFAAIPHTLERTTLGNRRLGAAVNLETDAFGKWVLHALEEILGSPNDRRLRELLQESGLWEDPKQGDWG